MSACQAGFNDMEMKALIVFSNMLVNKPLIAFDLYSKSEAY